MSFYKEHYDVIIIGGSLAGMAAALQLHSKGISDILVLEKNNFPGGQAAGHVRDGFEVEAALPGTMFVGTKREPSKTGQFFRDMGINIDWQPLSECCRVVLPDFDIDITLHPGYERVAQEINTAVPGTYDGVIGLLNLCRQVYDSMGTLSSTWKGMMQLMLKHSAFLKTSGYSAAEIIATFHLPQKAIDILNAYWVFMGISLNALPFTEYALWMAEFFADNRVCRASSSEIASKMQHKAEKDGIQFEFCQNADKILVKNGKVLGVRTSRGDEIHCDYVVSTLYPNQVYTQMIEPLSEVPKDALKLVKSHDLAACPVSVTVTMEGTPEENGIVGYCTFFSDMLENEDSEETVAEIMAEDAEISAGGTRSQDTSHKSGKGCPTEYSCISAICPNYANSKIVPEGYTRLTVTALASAEAFKDITKDAYQDLKRQLANGLLDAYIQISGVDFMPWITEIDIATPATFSRYTDAWKGGVYGYLPSMEHHITARMQMNGQEHFIEGLAFADLYGAPSATMNMQIPEGLMAARSVLSDIEKKREAAESGQRAGASEPEKTEKAEEMPSTTQNADSIQSTNTAMSEKPNKTINSAQGTNTATPETSNETADSTQTVSVAKSETTNETADSAPSANTTKSKKTKRTVSSAQSTNTAKSKKKKEATQNGKQN